MPEPEEPTRTDEPRPVPDDEPDRSGLLGRWVVAVPAAAFLVGLGLGALVVGVAGDDEGSAAEATESPSASPGPATAVVVPDSCLEAAETVEEATGLIREGVGAIRSFEPDELIDLLDQLEDLDNLAREQAATCTASTVTDAPLPDASATPSPSEPTSG